MTEKSSIQKESPGVEKARLFAFHGDLDALNRLFLDGAIAELPEFEQRQIIAQAFTNRARVHDECMMRELYPDGVPSYPEYELSPFTISQQLRAKSLDILLNPNEKKLTEQFGFEK